MNNVFTTSVGRKLIMSLSGLFLIVFLVLHLSINLIAVFNKDAFNVAAHFMASNPFIKVMEPMLALGFIFHIVWAVKLNLKNSSARPKGYAVKKSGRNSSFASRNMTVLGLLILGFLILHILNFYTKIKLGYPEAAPVITLDGVAMDDTYALLKETFTGANSMIYNIVYIISSILLGLHISHGCWSAMQTLGACNDIWRKRFTVLGGIFGFIFAVGFAAIPVAFYLQYS